MRKRLVFAGGLILLLTVGYALGGTLGGALLRRGPGTVDDATPSAADPGPGAGTAEPPGSVDIEVASSDVPGCLEPDAPFRAIVSSRWRDKSSRNVLVFRWRGAPPEAGTPETDDIVVRVEGQTMEARLTPGKAFPHVDLALPLGVVTPTVALSTFVFERRDDAGRACFRWEQPPGTPRPYELPGGSRALAPARTRTG